MNGRAPPGAYSESPRGFGCQSCFPVARGQGNKAGNRTITYDVSRESKEHEWRDQRPFSSSSHLCVDPDRTKGTDRCWFGWLLKKLALRRPCMTYQRDPDRGPTRRPSDYIRRDDGSWSPLALLLGAVLLVLIGWVVFADRSTGPSTTTTGQTNTGGSTKVPQQRN